MAESIIKLTLDTFRENRIQEPVVMQHDYNSRFIDATFTTLGVFEPISAAAEVMINAKRADGQGKSFSGEVNADGTVRVPIDQWMCALDDRVTCTISAVSATPEQRLSTMPFTILVKASPNTTELPEEGTADADVLAEVLAGEKERVLAEGIRSLNENARERAEEARVRAEEQRLTDEATRVANEAERVSSELSRDATFKGWAQDIASLPSFDSRISANSDRLTNIEAGLPSSVWRVDGTATRIKDVPENARPKAIVSKIGGMSYKTENLIPFPYADANKTVAGVTYTDNGDGSIAANGTPTAAAAFKLFQMDVRDLPSVITISLTGTFTNLQFRFLLYDEKGDVITTISTSSSNGAVIDFSNYQTASYVVGYIYRVENGVLTSGSCYPMLNEGSTAKPYTPYFEGLRFAKVTAVKSVGRNLFNINNIYNTETITGTSFTPSEGYYNRDFFTNSTGSEATVPMKYIDKLLYLEAGDYTFSWEARMSSDASDVLSLAEVNPKNGALIQTNVGMRNGGVLTVKESSCWTIRRATNQIVTYSNFRVNKGAAQPYTPYVEHTLPIPEAVQALDGWGQGIPGTECYNFLDWRPEEGVTEWHKKAKKLVLDGITNKIAGVSKSGSGLYFGYLILNDAFSNGSVIFAEYNKSFTEAVGNAYIGESKEIVIFHKDQSLTTASAFNTALQENPIELVYACVPEVTDISDLLPADNLITVEGGGTLTFENEYGYDIPNTVTYMLKEVTA